MSSRASPDADADADAEAVFAVAVASQTSAAVAGPFFFLLFLLVVMSTGEAQGAKVQRCKGAADEAAHVWGSARGPAPQCSTGSDADADGAGSSDDRDKDGVCMMPGGVLPTVAGASQTSAAEAGAFLFLFLAVPGASAADGPAWPASHASGSAGPPVPSLTRGAGSDADADGAGSSGDKDG